MKENISIVGPLPPPIGGVSESVRKLLDILMRNNEDLKIFNTSSNNEREDLYEGKKISAYIRSVILIFRFISFSIRNRSNECHLFTTSNSAFLRDIPIILIAKITSRKFFIHFHSKKEGELFLKKGFIKLLFFFLDFSDGIIVLSEKHQSYFSRFSKKPLFILENFCISYEFSPSFGNANQLIYCGRLSEKKGFFDLLEAAKKIHHTAAFSMFVLGLSDNEETEKRIEAKSSLFGDTIKYYGNVFGEQKKELFSEAGCFIFPSHFENSPVVLKEAMMANLIIIASDIDANKNVLRDYPGAFYFNVTDPNNLSIVLKDVLNIPKDQFDGIRNRCRNFPKFDETYALNVISSIRETFS